MSTSLLYHGFGLVGYRYVRQHFQEGKVIFRIEKPRERLFCPQCGTEEVWAQGGVERTFRTLPIGGKVVEFELKVPRVWCGACGQTRQIKLGFADPKKHYTRAFERYVLDLSRNMTIKDVAEHLQISWDTVKDIQARSLKRRFGKPKLHKLKEIAIDEISIGKGHRQFADTLEAHQEGVLAWYDYRISTGPLEGTNNKIKTMQRQAYGFRDHEFFKLKILGLHQTRRALIG